MDQLSLYYDPRSYRGKQTLAYAQGQKYKLRDVDFTKNPLTSTQLRKCIADCGVEACELVEEVKHFEIDFPLKDATDDDWIKLLSANPGLIKYPIAEKNNKYYLIKNPSDINKL